MKYSKSSGNQGREALVIHNIGEIKDRGDLVLAMEIIMLLGVLRREEGQDLEDRTRCSVTNVKTQII